MNVSRGDIVLTRIPHAAGGRGKKRPAVVIQSNHYNQSERHLIVAEITSNLSRATEPVNLLIEIATQDGRATGLASDSVVTCLQLATISADRIDRVIRNALVWPSPKAGAMLENGPRLDMIV